MPQAYETLNSRLIVGERQIAASADLSCHGAFLFGACFLQYAGRDGLARLSVGRQLAERLTEEQPGLKVLYISGYTSGIVGTDGVLDDDATLLRKPFTPEELTARVRETLL